jgi:hypothetical protein
VLALPIEALALTEGTDYDPEANLFFVVGSSMSGVLSIDADKDYQPGFIVSGVGANTKVWVDSTRATLYYSGFNRVDAWTIRSEPQWSSFFSVAYPDTVDMLTGDELTGLVVIASKDTGKVIVVNPSSIEQPLVLDLDVTAITAANGRLYFASASVGGYSIQSCVLSQVGCSPLVVLKTDIESTVTSVALDAEGTVFYGTIDGVFSVAGDETGPLVDYVPTITPYAIMVYPTSDVLYFLDIQGSDIELASCKLSNCPSTLSSYNTLVSAETNTTLNGYLVGDKNGTALFWACTSSPSQIYRYNVTTKTNIPWTSVTGRVGGLALSKNDSVLYVIVSGSVVQYDTRTALPVQMCVNGTDLTVGAIEVNGTTLFWSDIKSGKVFKCDAGCTTCQSSILVNAVPRSCGEWQSLAASTDALYEQFGCGGIVQVSQSKAPVTLQDHGFFPFSDLAAGPRNFLAWTIPFRHTILRANAESSELLNLATLLSGTGSFSDLIANTQSTVAQFFWVDTVAQKILFSSIAGDVSDLSLQSASGLSLYNSAKASPPSPIILPSAAPSVIVVSASASILPVESTAAPQSNTQSETPSLSYFTAPASFTPSTSASVSVSLGFMGESETPTPSVSHTDFLFGSASNTRGVNITQIDGRSRK